MPCLIRRPEWDGDRRRRSKTEIEEAGGAHHSNSLGACFKPMPAAVQGRRTKKQVEHITVTHWAPVLNRLRSPEGAGKFIHKPIPDSKSVSAVLDHCSSLLAAEYAVTGSSCKDTKREAARPGQARF